MAWINEGKRLNRETGKKETYYSVRWREGTQNRAKGLGFITRGEATAMLKIIEGKLARGEPVDPPPPTASGSEPVADEPKPAPTLATFLDTVFLPGVQRDKAPRTYASARTSAAAIKKRLGEKQLDELTFKVIDEYVSARKKEGRRSRTLILELWVLRGALQLACDRDELPDMPKLPKIRDRDRRKHKFLTPRETKALLAALRPPTSQPHVTWGSPPLQYDALSYLAVLVALNTGARKNEVLSRGWEDVRWEQGPHGTLIIGAKPEIGFRMKTDTDRAVPLTPELHAELLARHKLLGEPFRGLIFPSSENPDRPRKDFRSALEGACKRAGLPFVHPHALRHTWASRLAMSGVDRRTLMALGGWTDGRMLDEVYAHTTDAHMADVMARNGIKPDEDA